MNARQDAALNPRMVEVLLATYNGAEFLAEQIDSLLRQTYGIWRVLARDDSSSDRTVDILRRYADWNPERLAIVTDDDGNLGYAGNFARLLEKSTADYLAFCDQDDVWLADKLAVGNPARVATVAVSQDVDTADPQTGTAPIDREEYARMTGRMG